MRFYPNFYRFLCLTVWLIPSVLLADVATDDKLSIDKAIERTLQYNPSLKHVQSKFEAMSQLPLQAGALPDPILHLNAMNLPTDTFDSDQEPMTQLQIGLSQSFPFPGKLKLREQASRFEVRAAQEDIDERRLKLIYQVRLHWWHLFYLAHALSVLETNQNLLRQFIDTAKTKYEVGKGLQQDVLLAQVELSKLLDRKIQLNALQRHQKIKLNILMDQLPNTDFTLDLNIVKHLPKLKLEADLYQLAETTSPLLQALNHQLDASQARVDLAKRDFYPNFEAGVMYGARDGNNPPLLGGDSRSDFLSFKLGVSLPIFAYRKQSRALSQRKYELVAQRFHLQDLRQKVIADISTQVTEYDKARQQAELFDTGLIPQAKQTVSSMLAGYQVNQVDFLNLVRSQITLLHYELQYWKALTEAKQAVAKLIATVGKESIYE